MFIQGEDGTVFNFAHVAQLRIGESEPGSNELWNRLPFYIEVVPAHYYSHDTGIYGGSIPTLARFATREEANGAIELIIRKTGGIPNIAAALSQK